jgi:hypothetical protein
MSTEKIVYLNRRERMEVSGVSFVKFDNDFVGSPTDYWLGIRDQISDRSIYVSLPLTSAGFNIEMTMKDEKEDPGRSRRMNSRLGLRNLAMLDGRLAGRTLIFPGDLGSLEDKNGNRWGQTEYNFFWACMLANLSGNEAGNLWRELGNRLEREKEKKAADVLPESLGEVTEGSESRELKITQMIMLGGKMKSSGCGSEIEIARKLGIKVEFLVFNSNHRGYNGLVKDHPIFELLVQWYVTNREGIDSFEDLFLTTQRCEDSSLASLISMEDYECR